MYLNNQNLSVGLHRLVDRVYKAMHMNLDLDLWITPATEIKTFASKSDELVVFLLTGEITLELDGVVHRFSRANLFEEIGAALLVSPHKEVKVTAHKPSEVLLIYTANQKLETNRVFDTSSVKGYFFGKNQWDNTALRHVRTYFDYTNCPESNLVLGEVISYPGRWSSYTPHYHEQPEIYFFKFDKSQAFGISVAGENAYIVRENDINAIEANVVHPVVAAPGYPLYFCWIIRHLENNPWKQRIVAKEHEWLEAKDCNYWKKGQV